MKIVVNSLKHKTLSVDVESKQTVREVKGLIEAELRVAISQQRLVYKGENLENDQEIGSSGIEDGGAINLIVRPRTGGKPKCTFTGCSAPRQRIVGDCSFCDGHFCASHRLLEQHKCQGLEDCKKESHERNAERLNSEKTAVAKVL